MPMRKSGFASGHARNTRFEAARSLRNGTRGTAGELPADDPRCLRRSGDDDSTEGVGHSGEKARSSHENSALGACLILGRSRPDGRTHGSLLAARRPRNTPARTPDGSPTASHAFPCNDFILGRSPSFGGFMRLRNLRYFLDTVVTRYIALFGKIPKELEG